MILNAIILILLVCGFFAGFRTGLIKQLILLLGYILAFFYLVYVLRRFSATFNVYTLSR